MQPTYMHATKLRSAYIIRQIKQKSREQCSRLGHWLLSTASRVSLRLGSTFTLWSSVFSAHLYLPNKWIRASTARPLWTDLTARLSCAPDACADAVGPSRQAVVSIELWSLACRRESWNKISVSTHASAVCYSFEGCDCLEIQSEQFFVTCIAGFSVLFTARCIA